MHCLKKKKGSLTFSVGREPALSGILSVYSHSQMLNNRDGIISSEKSAGAIMHDNPSKTLQHEILDNQLILLL